MRPEDDDPWVGNCEHPLDVQNVAQCSGCCIRHICLAEALTDHRLGWKVPGIRGGTNESERLTYLGLAVL